MMPELTGFEVARELKNDIRTSHIPLILLTAKADTKSKLEGLNTGADAYLTKPFDKNELTIRIEQLLKLRLKLRNRYADLNFVQKSISDENEIEFNFLVQAKEFILENRSEDILVEESVQAFGFISISIAPQIKGLNQFVNDAVCAISEDSPSQEFVAYHSIDSSRSSL